MIEASMDEIAGSAADSGEMRFDRYGIVALEAEDRIDAKASSAANPNFSKRARPASIWCWRPSAQKVPGFPRKRKSY
jgi:hypothetical protein